MLLTNLPFLSPVSITFGKLLTNIWIMSSISKLSPTSKSSPDSKISKLFSCFSSLNDQFYPNWLIIFTWPSLELEACFILILIYSSIAFPTRLGFSYFCEFVNSWNIIHWPITDKEYQMTHLYECNMILIGGCISNWCKLVSALMSHYRFFMSHNNIFSMQHWKLKDNNFKSISTPYWPIFWSVIRGESSYDS